MKKNTSLFSTFIFLVNQVKLRLFSILIIVYLLLTSSLQSQTIYNIQFSPASPCQLKYWNHVYISLDYKDLPANAKQLLAFPVSGGLRTWDWASIHTIDPSGNGHAELDSGIGEEARVDCVAIIIRDNSHSEIAEIDIPVDYEVSYNAITNISVSPASPAALQYDQTVTVTFDYLTNISGDVKFAALALYAGNLIMNGAKVSSAYPNPSGNATAAFNLDTDGGYGESADEIRVRMMNIGHGAITEASFPVQYQFADNVICDIHGAIATPASLPLNSTLNVYYKYTTNEHAGVKVHITPYHSGSPVSASTSSVTSHSLGTGSGSGSFKIVKGPVLVDQIRVTMYNSNESVILYERYEPVSYFFSNNTISNVAVTPTSPAYIANSTTAIVYFNYTEDVTENIKIEGQCYTGGSPTSGSTPASTSLLSDGSGHLNLTVNGAATADQVRLRMLNTAGTVTYVDLYVPVELHFLGNIVTDVKNNSNAPFSFGLKQNYPNPFNPSTTISYSLAKNCNTIIKVYNLLGCEVTTLVNEMQSAGEHTVEWNAQNLPSGIYLCKLQAGSFIRTQKLVLLK